MSSWIVGVGLSLLGLSDQEKATVEAAIPIADKMIQHYNANAAVFNTLFADWQLIVPAIQIVADAMAKKGMSTGQLLTLVGNHGVNNDRD